MGIVNKNNLRAGLVLIVVNGIFCAASVSAAEWQSDFKAKSGFSDFTPPPSNEKYQNNYELKQWASGSSFNEDNKVRFSPVISKNPWKPVKAVRYKKTFASQRPWGNVPARKPKNKNNMKFYDQQFKQWSHRQGSQNQNDIYSQTAQPFTGAYGYPFASYNSPAFAPSIYSGSNINRYGNYPGGLNPYAGSFARPNPW